MVEEGVVVDVDEVTVIATVEEAAEVVMVVEEAVDEGEMVEEAVVVMEEDAVVVEEVESHKDSMSKTRTHSLHCRDMFSECIVKGDRGKRIHSSYNEMIFSDADQQRRYFQKCSVHFTWGKPKILVHVSHVLAGACYVRARQYTTRPNHCESHNRQLARNMIN